LSEVIHVLASRSWWGYKRRDRVGRGGSSATAAHRRKGRERGVGLMAFQERRGEDCFAASRSRGL